MMRHLGTQADSPPLTRSIPPSRPPEIELVNPLFLISFPTLWTSSSRTTLELESWEEATAGPERLANALRAVVCAAVREDGRGRDVIRRSIMANGERLPRICEARGGRSE
jgi:hypothetical protein